MESDRAPIEALSAAPLSRQQRKIVDALAGAYPRRVAHQFLFDRLYDDDPEGGPLNPSNVVAVQITRLRRVLPKYGWTIPSNRSGPGVQSTYGLAPIEIIKEVAA